MIDTFLISKRIEKTYKVNAILNWLRNLPVIGKHIPYGLYSKKWLKDMTVVLYYLGLAGKTLLYPLLYILIILGISEGAKFIGICVPSSDLIRHILTFFSIAGIVINNKFLDPSEDKYYGICLMRMDAKEYILSDMIFNLLRQMIGFMAVLLLAFRTLMPQYVSVMLIAMMTLGKFFGGVLMLKNCEKNNPGRTILFNILTVLICLALAVSLPLLGYTLPVTATVMICIMFSALGAFSMVYLFRYDNYQKLCKATLSHDQVFATNNQNEQNEKAAAEAITTAEIKKSRKDTERKRGYAYFHGLFVERHSKLLVKRMKLISVILFLALLAANAVGLYFRLKGEASFFGEGAVRFIRTLPFIMYLMNTGEELTRAMFANCDRAMLSYNFYRKPEIILGMFKQRLKTVILVNMVPAALLGGCLCSVNAFSIYRSDIKIYAVLVLATLSLNIFFSVHRLVIYYLFQPYTEGLELKSPAYNIANWLTYLVSYMLMNSEISPMLLAGISVIFSVIYVIGALILAYKLAPKRFRIRTTT